MKIAYFDCFAGIAGDMALAALLDCGVPLEELRAALSSLATGENWEISTHETTKNGLRARAVRIAVDGQSDAEEAAHADGHHHQHNHETLSTHDEHEYHAHSHHAHEHEPHVHHHGRSMAEIRALIERSDLSTRVKNDALKIFGLIAQAEAKMHATTPDKVHFHEIGGLDSLMDICGVAWCLEYLGIEEIYCSALPHFGGTVQCAHGLLPLPAPATLEMLRDIPLVPSGLQGEMVTPTGAAIVAALAQSFGDAPAMTPQQTGVGCGTKDWPDRPNILRITLGEKTLSTQKGDGLEWRELSLLETNLDDMNPQLLGDVLERALEVGALDVWLAPIHMKKNRAATLLHILCAPPDEAKFTHFILSQTTSLGVRVSRVQRAALPRREYIVGTSFGEVRVKEAIWREGNVRKAALEYDDVKRLSTQHGVPAREVFEAAMRALHIQDANGAP